MMGKRYLFVFCFYLASFFSVCYAGDIALMDVFNTDDWSCKKAIVSYDDITQGLKIRKSGFTPNWGSAKLELGKINVSDPEENNLRFEVGDLNGKYAINIHYGGKDLYDSQYIELQDSTNMAGEQKYNISETLRSAGLSDLQEIQLEIKVIDDDDQPGNAMVLFENLTFGYDDNFAVIPSRK